MKPTRSKPLKISNRTNKETKIHPLSPSHYEVLTILLKKLENGQWFTMMNEYIKKRKAITCSSNSSDRQMKPGQNGAFVLLFPYDTVTKFNSSGLKAPWTISWTVLFRRQTSESSSTAPIRVLISTPDAASVSAWKIFVCSTSVTTVDGIKETLSLAHSNALAPYARVSASKAYVTWGKKKLPSIS